MFVFFVVLV